MGDINTNIRIDRLQKVVKEIAGRGTVRTKVTTFYPESSGTAVDFTPDEIVSDVKFVQFSNILPPKSSSCDRIVTDDKFVQLRKA